jgi:tannase/feruloyl esterase
MFQPWLIRANQDAQGHQILDASKLPALHAAVMRACADAHGIIEDPRACTFDPVSLRCQGADSTSCLSPAQVNAVRAIYREPTYRDVQLFDGGEPYGSELSWQGWMISAANDPGWRGDTAAGSLGRDYLRYMAHWRNPPASVSLQDVRFTPEGYERLEPLGGIYNATDPDLRAFRAHGGKLIPYHGWADQAISPSSTLDYYAASRASPAAMRRHSSSRACTWSPACTTARAARTRRATPPRRSTSWTNSSTGSRTTRRPAQSASP